MSAISRIENSPQLTDAEERIAAFEQRFGSAHLEFACHGAFPLALTPDLLYRLRDYPFQPRLQVPWLAVADLLQSRLCHEIGQELYEMDRNVRQVLLNRLVAHYGEQRLHELSDFLLNHLQRHFRSGIRDLQQAQFWIALAYVKPEKAAQLMALELNQLLQQPNFSLWLQKSALLETLAEPLQKHGYQPLLTLARGMGEWAKGEPLAAEAQFAELRNREKTLSVAGVTINLPPPPVALKTFAFETVTVDRRGEIIQREDHQAQYFTEDLSQGIALEMVSIPGGRYLMGSPSGEGYDREKPQHWVSVPPFFMGKYPVTQAQWRAVAALPKVNRDLNPDPANFKGNDRPVERVNWFDAVEFCERLSRKTGREYRLPSEAQWEYACRAGTTTPFYFGETITSKLANYNGTNTYAEEPKGEHREKTTPVGSFPPNRFGLYDLHGNVWEWCLDDWHSNYEGAPEDGSAWINKNDNHSQKPSDSRTVLRGGSWLYSPNDCRSAYRSSRDGRDDYSNPFGFRVLCVAGRTPP